MVDPRTVIEGSLKYRDGRKWKSRWCVVTKLSPVADCIHVQLYRDSKERCKNAPTKASLSLEGFLGLETGFTLDKESNTMAIICPEVVVVLAFDSRELLIQWQVKIRSNVPEEQQFLVQVAHAPPKSKLSCGPARLHLQDHLFSLTSGVPPRLLGTWPLKELRRYGMVDGKFCFEGGSRCGRGEGLHILHTNQGEELAAAFDTASEGKLAGKRKLSHKGGMMETPSLMSLQPRPRRKETSHCSTESSRPLLSSGSEGSNCDACSEIVRFAMDTPLPEESYHQKGVCKVHYRWPSCMSHCGHTSTISSSEVESVDTVSLTISDIQESVISKAADNTNQNSNVLTVGTGQAVWTFTHCNKCGRHYCARSTFTTLERHRTKSPETRTSGSGFTPQWTMDLPMVSPSCEVAVHTKTAVSGKPADRASLCSQSSHSSGTSTASTSSSSEYNVPRSFLETLYDRPRSFLHVDNAEFHLRQPPVRSPSQVIHQQMSPGMFPPCTCSADNRQSMVGQSPVGDNLPGVHGVTGTCPCWNKAFPTHFKDSKVVTRSSSGSSDSPLASPKKGPQQPSAVLGGQHKHVLQMPSGVNNTKLPCTCGQSPTIYPNYDVPRTALANLYLKERQGLPADGVQESKTKEPLPVIGEQYDVPRKFKEQLLEEESRRQQQGSSIPLQNMCTCGTVFSPETAHTCKGISQDQHQTCACQRVVLWAGNLCWKKTDDHVCTGQGFFTPGPKSPNLAESTSPLTSASTGVSAVCKEPSKIPEGNLPPTDASSSNTDGVSATGGSSSKENGTMDGQKKKPCPHYANLHFIQSLPLYENTGCVLARINDQEEKHAVKSHVLAQTPGCRKPPLPPRYSGCGTNSLPRSMKVSSTSNPNSSRSAHGSPDKGSKLAVKDPPLKQSSQETYELMSFRKPENTNYTGVNCDGNYLLMHPVDPWKGDNQNCETTSGDGATQGQEDMCQHGKEKSEVALPLRPFMPYLLPCREELKSPEKPSKRKTPKSPFSKKRQFVAQEVQSKSSLSSSLGDLKKKVLMRRRSNSADGRQESPGDEVSETEDYTQSPVSSPKATPTRKHSLFSKLTLRSKDKNISDITPPSSVPSTPNNRSLENLCKIPFHRSADCLKLKGDFRFSEEDLTRTMENINGTECGSQVSKSIKRSSSVPCKSHPAEQVTSPSDSGVSTSLPRSSETVCSVGSNGVHQIISLHSSLPRKLGDRTHVIPEDRIVPHIIRCSGRECGQLHCCDQDGQATQNCNHCHHFIIPADRFLTIAPKSSSSSSASSDMSDYIETMSLCSRSSTSSGSSSEYMRPEELCAAMAKTSGSWACILKPRSCKEYHSVDRTGIQEMEAEDSPQSPVPTTPSTLVETPCETIRTPTTTMPLLGFGGSPPTHMETCIKSQHAPIHFVFPKPAVKNLNYMQVGVSEPVLETNSDGANIQYSSLDSIVQRGSERSQDRKESLNKSTGAPST